MSPEEYWVVLLLSTRPSTFVLLRSVEGGLLLR
jgi:hypothetical protein